MIPSCQIRLIIQDSSTYTVIPFSDYIAIWKSEWIVFEIISHVKISDSVNVNLCSNNILHSSLNRED